MGEDLAPGAYDSVITEALAAQLSQHAAAAVERDQLDAEEIPDRLALVVSDLVHRALLDVSAKDRPTVGPRIVRAVTERLMQDSDAVVQGDLVVAPTEVLRTIAVPTPAGGWHQLLPPMTPLLDTTVLTGARGEPTMQAQVRSEVPSADSIDAVIAFIRLTGLNPLVPALRDHLAAGRRLRILTTTYTGSTEQRALDLLSELGAEVRVSYDLSGTRLHAKAWLFRRNSGMSTAYVGSSNLTHQAQVTGLEWNVRLSARRNRPAVEKLATVFDAYWEGGDFVDYDPSEFAAHVQRSAPTAPIPTFEIRPHPFQERMLEQLRVARDSGLHRNLVVAATGTGKTVLAAFDYLRLRRSLESSRLLFVAHRQEILQQSLDTFRAVLRDPSFGELWVAGERPTRLNHVFASIQSITANGVAAIDPGHFDVVVVDEFHHAAADSYKRLLQQLHPRELLGLTATPERTDGRSILHWFDDRIAVELRIWDAIDQQRLVPFLYYGVDDGTDLQSVPRRGREYDLDALASVYTADTLWIDRVLREVHRLVPDVTGMTAMGFCASVSHARFTSARFTAAGIPSAMLDGSTPQAERARILSDLRSGRLRAVFSVDVLSEGVDIPEVDTLFLMRPTESATVFLQQLGRGLRRFEGKGACLVLDFIGHQAEQFRFDLRYRALLGCSRADLQKAVEQGFPYLPAGCELVLEEAPAARVLAALRQAIPSQWRQQVSELQRMGGDPSLSEYLEETGLDLDDVYRGDHSWMSLRVAAGLDAPPPGVHELAFRKAVGRLGHIDDRTRLTTYRRWLSAGTAPAVADEPERRLLRMLVASLMRSVPHERGLTLEDASSLVWADRRACADLASMLAVLERAAGGTGDAVLPLASSRLPLELHARYTRDEILSAAGVHAHVLKPPAWQNGVWWAEEQRVDLLPFTIDKSSGTFSPTTRYRDYAITDSLIHWESQSSTRTDSPTGRRYIDHAGSGSSVLLFARRSTADRAYWFLGPARYVSHEGERPMAITWRLHTPLPETLYSALAATVA